MVLGAGTCGSTARASSAGVTTARGQLALAGTGLGSELYSRAGRFCHLGIAGNSDVDRVRETDEYAIVRRFSKAFTSGEETVTSLTVEGVGMTSQRTRERLVQRLQDRKSTRLNSSHVAISYAV